MKLVDAVDRLWDRPFRVVSGAWHHVTGKSSYVVAVLCLYVGGSIMILGGVLDYVRGDAFGVLNLVLAAMWGLITIQRLVQFRQIRSFVEDPAPAETVAIPPLVVPIVWTRRFWACIETLSWVINPLGWTWWRIGFVIFIGAHYMVFHGHLPGKTVWRTAFEKAKALVGSIRLPEWTPAPRPIPVPNGL